MHKSPTKSFNSPKKHQNSSQDHIKIGRFIQSRSPSSISSFYTDIKDFPSYFLTPFQSFSSLPPHSKQDPISLLSSRHLFKSPPLTSFKVLDAPDLSSSSSHSVLDWGSEDHLCIVLPSDLYIYSPKTSKVISQLNSPQSTCCSFDPSDINGGRLAAGNLKGELRVFDIEKQEILLLHDEHKGSINNCIWTSSVVTSAGSDGLLIHTDLRSPALVNKFKAHYDEITKLVSSSETFATASEDKSIKIWQGFYKFPVSSFNSFKTPVHSMTWTGQSSHSGQSGRPVLIFGDNEKKLNILNFYENPGKFEELASYPEKVTSLQFLSDENRILTGFEDGSLALWSYPNMSLLGKSAGHQGTLRFLSISPEETHAVSGGDDETLRFWNIPNMKKKEEKTFLIDFR